MKVLFILNPRSGPQAGRKDLVPLIQPHLGREVSFRLTEYGGHATLLAREAVAAGFTRIVAVGGDGTINEVAQALVDKPVQLGIVPRGSGNGLARHLGIMRRPAAAVALALDPAARIRPIDSGTANGRPFFNVMGLGLDAQISEHFSRSKQRGLASYARISLREFLRARPEQVTATWAGGRETFPILLLAVANSPQYGNGAQIAPGAEVDDGRLDLIAVERPNLLRAAALAVRLFTGTLEGSPLVRHRIARGFVLERPAPGLVHVDGEAFAAAARIEIEVRPKSVGVVVPS